MTPRTPKNTPLALLVHPTQQQVFDAVVAHAAQMPNHAVQGVGCLYRTSTGNACFVGGLVTDEEAGHMDSTSIASTSVNSLAQAKILPDRLNHPELVDLLSELQAIHDARTGMYFWPSQFRSLARHFALSDAAVTQHFPATTSVN